MSVRTDCAANAVSAAASDTASALPAGRSGMEEQAAASAATTTRLRMGSDSRTGRGGLSLQNVPGEILALRELGKPRVHVGGVHAHLRHLAPRVEGNLLEELFHDRVQAPRADVLGALVHREGDLGDAPHAIGRIGELDALRGEERLVLAREAGVGGVYYELDGDHREARELDADRKAP